MSRATNALAIALLTTILRQNQEECYLLHQQVSDGSHCQEQHDVWREILLQRNFPGALAHGQELALVPQPLQSLADV